MKGENRICSVEYAGECMLDENYETHLQPYHQSTALPL